MNVIIYNTNCCIIIVIYTVLHSLVSPSKLLTSSIIKLKSRLSVRTFLVVSFSAMAAWIDVRLARRDSYVFWHDQVYF